MNNVILISIIIPHYNSPKKLKRLLDTIPKKKEIQIIVVDDISNQRKEEYFSLIDSYKDYVEFYDNTIENKSAGGARNIGLKKAKGQWILFADADDFFKEFFWDIIRDYIYSSEDIIFFPPNSIKEDNGRDSARALNYTKLALMAWYEKEKYNKISRQTELNIRYNWPVPWSKLIKRDLIEKNNIEFEVVKYSNDVMFSAKAGFYAKKIDVCFESIYVVTEGINTLTTRKNDSEETKIRLEIFKKRCDFWRDKLSYEDSVLLFCLNGKEKIKFFIKKKILKKYDKEYYLESRIENK